MKTYIVDTLNVINLDNELKSMSLQSKEIAVSAFCSRLANFLNKYSAYKVLLVIDGSLDSINKYHQNIELITTKSTNADDKIKELISNSKIKSNLEIVSSDTEVYNFARMNAVNIVTASEFLKILTSNNISKITNSQLTKKHKKEKPANASKKEIKLLSEMFNDSDIGDWDYKNSF